jgi:dTDP-4-amino-4,6-dideoxygalactose transaminase
MHVPLVDLKAQYVAHKSEIDGAMANVIRDTAFIRGKYVTEFEEAYTRKYGVKHCISVANGTDAIYITLKMLGIGPGNEVITTANSWIGSSETITQTGARPVFIDVEEDFYDLDTTQIEKKITSRTKAILPVHLLGQPAKMDSITEICQKHNLLLIEDCAQSHFAQFKGQKVGTFGSAGIFSFYPGKNLGAYGDAGAIVTDDADLAAKIRVFANHGADRVNKHDHVMEGVNSRLDGLQAAILSAKLPHIDAWTHARQERAARYVELFASMDEVITPKIRPSATHVFHVFNVRVPKRDALRAHLKQTGVETNIHYPTPLPFLKAYQHLGHVADDFPVAVRHAREILSLPIFPELSDKQMRYVVKTVKDFYAHA